MAKKTKAEVETVVSYGKPSISDFDLVINPIYTEKSMTLMQELNKVIVRVRDGSNKIAVKNAFQKLFNVKVVDVNIINVPSKAKSRGGRYKGTVSGYKKAIITIAEGSTLDLFKE